MLEVLGNFWWVLLVALGFFAGRAAERLHYASIRKREARFARVPAITAKWVDDGRPVASAQLCTGSVVVSIDYFKRFLSSFRMVFGGEMRSYSSLIDRGRREALLRMKEQRPDADLFVNCRLETSTVSSNAGRTVGTVEVLAYGTAVKFVS